MEFSVGPILGCNTGQCDSPRMAPDARIETLVPAGAIPFAKRPVDPSDDTVLALSLEAIEEACAELRSRAHRAGA